MRNFSFSLVLAAPLIAALTASSAATGGPALAETAPKSQAQPPRSGGVKPKAEEPYAIRLSVQTVALSKELLESTATVDIDIKSSNAVQRFGQIVLGVNEHFEDADVVEAATIKAGGDRVEVPSDKILVSSAPNASTLSVFEADVKMRTIVFPDVEVGDTVHYVFRTKRKSAPLPGGFSYSWALPDASHFESVIETLDAPADLPIQATAVGFSENSMERDGRLIRVWTMAPTPAHAAEPGSISNVDRNPHLLFSSFGDWREIGQSFFEGADPMSRPTEKVRALAESITKDIPDRKEKARAIFDWVSKNVRYMAIYLGRGGFVPHDADSVLANKYGDCKDHATLMRAMLAAVGVEADYVLINTQPIYQQFEAASPDWFNHAIVYLPEFKLYADPTASHSSFGALPEYEASKPVLRVGKSGVTPSRTPALSAETNQLTIHADVVLREDGTVEGTASTEAAGPISTALRGAVDQAIATGADEFATANLHSRNWRGSGSLDKSDPTDHAEPYRVDAHFDLANRFLGQGANGNALPVGPLLVASAFEPMNNFLREARSQAFFCEAQTYRVVIDFHLPAGVELTNIPAGANSRAGSVSFASTYVMRDDTLHVERTFVSRLAGQVCTAELAKKIAPVIAAARDDYDYRPQFKKRPTRDVDASIASDLDGGPNGVTR